MLRSNTVPRHNRVNGVPPGMLHVLLARCKVPLDVWDRVHLSDRAESRVAIRNVVGIRGFIRNYDSSRLLTLYTTVGRF